MRVQFTLLPPELLSSIFEELNARSIARCRQTCKRFRSVIDGSLSVQYRLELDTSLLIESRNMNRLASAGQSPCRRTRADILTHVCRLNWSWKNLSWLYRHRHISINNYAAVYELSGGYFIQDLNSDFMAFDRTCQLSVLKLPYIGDGRESYPPERSKLQFDFRVVDLCMDPERDLLVVIERRDELLNADHYRITGKLRFLSLSSQKPHPAARNPYVTFDFESESHDHTLSVQIAGQYVGLLLSIKHLVITAPDKFYLWNIYSGDTVAEETSKHECAWNSFCFLSEDALLLPDSHRSFLDLYVFGFGPSSDQSKHPYFYLAASLALPTLQPDCTAINISVRSEPPISCALGVPKDSPHSRKAFRTDPRSAIVIVTLDYHVDSFNELDHQRLFFDTVKSQTFATFRSSLLRHAYEYRENHPPEFDLRSDVSTSGSVISCYAAKLGRDGRDMSWRDLDITEWESWGPKETRFGLLPVPPRWVCYVYGTRFISMKDRGRMWIGAAQEDDNFAELAARHRVGITLYDFNMMNARRTIKRPSESMAPCGDFDVEEKSMQGDHVDDEVPPYLIRAENILDESVLNAPEIFAEPVITSLPYRVMETQEMFDWDSVMIDDERIIGMKEDIDAIQLKSFDVLVF